MMHIRVGPRPPAFASFTVADLRAFSAGSCECIVKEFCGHIPSDGVTCQPAECYQPYLAFSSTSDEFEASTLSPVDNIEQVFRQSRAVQPGTVPCVTS
jgi:hypothetical protein